MHTPNIAEAGQKFAKMLQVGSSKPWPEVLQDMTGSKKLDASALVEYFKPLELWLYKQILAHSISVGWNSTVDDFFPSKSKLK